MLSVSEIMLEISATYKAIAEAEKREKELTDQYITVSDFLARVEKHKELSGQLAEAAERVRDLKISVALLKNNAKLALFAEVIPVALEVLAKYNGKPYGEKTREKISTEIKTRTGCHFWIGDRYGLTEYRVSPVDRYGFDITVGTRHENGQCKPLLVDNKIQLVTMEDLTVLYINQQYFEDIPAVVREMRNAHARAVAIQKELGEACSAFNAFVVDGIERIYKDKHIYPTII